MNDALSKVKPIAEEAADAILKVYHSADFETETKGDASPITAADKAAHKIITNGLTENTPYPVLSEEGATSPAERAAWQTFWLVDPLDGTKDFIAKNGDFTINIALIENGSPTFGLILAPAKGLLYYAEKGKGAFRELNGKLEKIENSAPQKELRCAVSRFHLDEKTKNFAAKLNIKDLTPAGSALKFGHLAEGTVDIYPRFAGSMEWDIAAGHCILEQAHCSLLMLPQLLPPSYNKENLVNGPFLAFQKDLLPLMQQCILPSSSTR